MSLIVQKFGGSSVRDAQRIRNVAGIIAETYLEGNDVLVVLSAQGDTTDDLIAKAEEINSHPSKREMDMLLSTGEQISVALCAMALESIVEPASLYEPAYTDGDDTLAIMDRVQEASCEESWISDIMFKDTVQALTPRERRIIALRYLSGQTQMQVAQAIGISQAQVSRLEKCALNHIKEQISCR